ncbi:MAG: mechanosensitive ion channel [Pseudomonadaceae bacterium]|nr:mechanosensitive ion channel [Pseudomonadaceae bacterium]
MDALSPDKLTGYAEQFISMGVEWAPKVLMAIVVLIIGLWLAKRVAAAVGKTLESRTSDPTLSKFLTSLVSILLKAIVFISVASMVGIETTSFIAVLGAAGLAVGLALQGSLANFAGGALILLFRPYKVGDFIEAQGVSGTVQSIQIFNTILLTPDNKRIIVPNGALSNDVITNYSAEERRRVDFVFGIGYDDDIRQAKSLIAELLEVDDRVLKDPSPTIVVSELADSSVNITVRVWVEASNYWGVFFDTTEQVKLKFDNKGISIPYPQTDVHLHKLEG